MVRGKKNKYKVNEKLLKRFRSILNKSQEEIVSSMRDDGAKIGHRAYQEAEQGKSMSLEIISTIARWYHSMKIATNLQIHNENINAETISDYDSWDDYGLITNKIDIKDRIKNYPANEQIPLYKIKDLQKLIKIIISSSKRKIVYNLTPTSTQAGIIDLHLKLINEIKQSVLSASPLDEDDNYGSEIPSAYLSSIKNYNDIRKLFKDNNMECYVGLYQQPILTVEPVNPSKLTLESTYTQGDYLDGVVPADYEPQQYGAFKTKIDFVSYAFFVFDTPNKYAPEINYENNFNASVIEELVGEDNFTHTGTKGLCLSKMREYYEKKYGYSLIIPTSKLEVREGISYSKYESGEDWIAGIEENANDVIELLLNDSRLKNFAEYDESAGNYNFEVREGREKWYKDTSKSNDYLREIVIALLQHDHKIPKVVNLILTAGKTLEKALDKIPELDPNYYDHIG